MIVESIGTLAYLTVGTAILRTAGLRGWALVPLGFATGMAFAIIVGTVQILTPLPTAPTMTWFVCFLVAAGCGLHLVRVEGPAPSQLLKTLGVGVLSVGAVAVVRSTMVVNIHPDSLRYMQYGQLLNRGQLDTASTDLLVARPPAAGILHAPAGLHDEFFVHSISPLIAVVTLLVAWWATVVLLEQVTEPRLRVLAASAAVALLAGTNRFVFHAFVINVHLLYGLMTMCILVASVVIERGAGMSRPLKVLQLIVVPALVFTRPEAGLLAAIALVPTFTSERIDPSHRRLLLATLGVSIVMLNGMLFAAHDGTGEAPVSVLGMLTFGVSCLALVPLVARPNTQSPRALILAEGFLWGAAVLAIIRDPSDFRESALATVQNVAGGRAGWDSTLVVLALIAVVVLACTEVPHRVHLRFALTTFVPASLLLAFLRGIPYRPGYGDSLARMLISMLPVLVLFLTMSVASEQWRLRADFGIPWGGPKKSPPRARRHSGP